MIRGSPSAAALLALIIAVSGASAQAAPQLTYANPIDIDYRYNFEQHNENISYRSGADPVIVVQRGEYYLFETIGEGYWRSRRARLRLAVLCEGRVPYREQSNCDDGGKT